MNNTTAPKPQNPKPSFSTKLKTAQIAVLIITVILIIAVIIFIAAGLSNKQSQEPTSIPALSLESRAPVVKITSYTGIIKSIDSASIQLAVTNEKNPGIQGTQTIQVNVTKQTSLIQRIRPAEIPKEVDSASVFKQKQITVKDLAIGDEIIVAAGGEDLFGQTQFNAASIMKIIITS